MQNQTNGPPQRVLHPRLGLGQVSVSLGAPRMPQTYIITTPKQDPKKSATKRKDASLDPTQGLPRMQNHQCELVLMVAQKIWDFLVHFNFTILMSYFWTMHQGKNGHCHSATTDWVLNHRIHAGAHRRVVFQRFCSCCLVLHVANLVLGSQSGPVLYALWMFYHSIRLFCVWASKEERKSLFNFVRHRAALVLFVFSNMARKVLDFQGLLLGAFFVPVFPIFGHKTWILSKGQKHTSDSNHLCPLLWRPVARIFFMEWSGNTSAKTEFEQLFYSIFHVQASGGLGEARSASNANKLASSWAPKQHPKKW